MNQKRSRNDKPFSPQWKRDRAIKLSSQVKPTESEVTNQLSNIHQVTPSDRALRFRGESSGWSYFNRGFFWGGLVSVTSIVSALGGMALTKIDVVEQQIVHRLTGNSLKPTSEKNSTLTTPLQILLVEVESDADALTGFSQAMIGNSKTILLLRVSPELNLAQAINIPTDTDAQIPGFGQGTVKDAYQLGGIDLLSQTIAQLSPDIAIDRYLRTTPEVFEQLTDSGKITLKHCDPRVRDCLDKSEQVRRQKTAFKTIRQRFNIPRYFADFEMAIAETETDLDTNISVPEIISVANFIKELEPDQVGVSLLPEYTPGTAIGNREEIAPSIPRQQQPLANFEGNSTLANQNPFQNNPVAVQNTTDNPELGRQVVAYLRKRNFRDVYLVKHIPLKLEETKIVSNYGQVETANYLKNILGFGNLEAESSFEQQELVLQLGEDALDLPNNHHLYH